MREIKFRGKSVEDGHWVYGYYVHLTDYFRNREIHRIYTGLSDSCPSVKDKYDFFPDTEEVDEETIAQFTGLYDKNGREIYEGDIVEFTKGEYRESLKSPFKPKIERFVVEYDGCAFRPLETLVLVTDSLLVIGNVVDNPKLLKGGQE